MIISCSVLLGMKNVPDKSGGENKQTRILCPINFCFLNHAIY
jgi:hypothetical protein